MDLAWTFELL